MSKFTELEKLEIKNKNKTDVGYLAIPINLLTYQLSFSAVVLYGWIYLLSRKHGNCYATNDYLGLRMGLTPGTISKLYSELKEKNVIDVSEWRVGNAVARRYTFPLIEIKSAELKNNYGRNYKMISADTDIDEDIKTRFIKDKSFEEDK